MPKPSARQDKNWLEQVVLVFSGVLVLASAGWLAWEAVAGTDGPPSIVVEVGGGEMRAGRWTARVTARNEGAATAGDVHIAVTAEGSGGSQRAEVVFAYLPPRASRSGWVTFDERPGPSDRIRTSVLGYVEP